MLKPVRSLATEAALVLLIVLFVRCFADCQTQTVLYTFSGGNDGGVPYSSLVMDKEGNFYGTTQQYGDESCTFAYMGCGTVFELSPPTSGGEWVYKVLYAFQGYEDGVNPSSQLTLDDDGNLYGTTIMGGAGSNFTNCGCYGVRDRV
jgi:hypothetical protein